MANIMKLTVEGLYQAQQTINTFYYVANGSGVAASLSFALADVTGFVGLSGAGAPSGSLAEKWQAAVVDEFQFVSYTSQDMYSDIDFYGSGFPGAAVGDGTGTATSPVLAIGFRSTRVRRSVRRGQKRFAGIDEEAMTAGGAYETAAAVVFNALGDVMGDVLTFTEGGGELTFTPTVLAFEKYTVATSGKTAYRPYDDVLDQLDHAAIGVQWELNPVVRTQGSRQYGKGI